MRTKILFTLFAFAIILSLVFGACTGKTSSPVPATSTPAPTAPATSGPATSATAQPDTNKPVYGGTLRTAATEHGRQLGYAPQFGAAEAERALYWAETMLHPSASGDLKPELATSWDVDATNKTITWHLRQGVKFHDGTAFNAEAVRWTFQETITDPAHQLQYTNEIKSMDVVDDYTIRFNLNYVNTTLLRVYGAHAILSPTAAKTNGKEWAFDHPVGTGPFKVVEFKRDAYIKMEKFKDYWRTDRPYLDAITLNIITDPMTSSAAFQNKELDEVQNIDITAALELKSKGLNVIATDPNVVGRRIAMIPDGANADSPFAKKEVRQAVEYALDRPAIAKALGSGYWIPLDQYAAPGQSGVYTPGIGRAYNVAKAKELLTAAGYADGFDTNIYCLASQQYVRDTAAAIQGYLKEVNIRAKVNLVDVPTIISLFQKGWKNGLLVMANNIRPIFAQDFGYGAPPQTMQISVYRSPEYDAVSIKIKNSDHY